MFHSVKTLEMLGNCFGSDILKKTAVCEWHERFKSNRESVEDDERSDRPPTSKTDENINKVREMLINNRKLTSRELAEDLNIAYGSIQDIVVNDLDLRRVAAKLIPKELNFMQKRDRVVAKDMISKAESDPTFIKRIITGDETWIYECDTQSRHQASEWKASNDQKNHVVFSRKRKRCSPFSWIITVLYITNFCQKVRQLIRSIIWAL